MSFSITHTDGSMESDVPLERLRDLVEELDDHADEEHPDIAVSDESGWTLSAFRSGLVIWENVEEPGDGSRHLVNVQRDDLVELLTSLARGDRDAVEAEPWAPGM